MDYAKVTHAEVPPGPIVFKRVSAPVGNGLGIPRTTAAAMFDTNPEEALKAEGDRAPVLELVDVAKLIAAKASSGKGPVRSAVEAEQIAQFADAIMGEMSECLLRDVQDAIGKRMVEAGLSTAKTRSTVRGNVVSALAADGVTFTRAGQNVRISMAKKGTAVTAPWVITRTVRDADNAAE
jgi:hypothetical protein